MKQNIIYKEQFDPIGSLIVDSFDYNYCLMITIALQDGVTILPYDMMAGAALCFLFLLPPAIARQPLSIRIGG